MARDTPSGIRGRELLVEAQVVAICHRYLAAIEPRPHRPGISPQEVFELLLTLSGALVSREVLEAFTGSIALYPIGCLIRLSGGAEGEVVLGGHPTRPNVRILWDASRRPLEVPRILALGDSPTMLVDAVGRPPTVPGADAVRPHPRR